MSNAGRQNAIFRSEASPDDGPVLRYAAHVGRDDTVIKQRLIDTPSSQGANTLTFVGGPTQFRARDELTRLLNSSPSYSPEQLSAAQDAVKRLSEPLSDDEKDTAAQTLASDFMIHED